MKALKTLRQPLDPFVLSESIDQRLFALRALAVPGRALTPTARPDQIPRLQSFFPTIQRQNRMMQKAIRGDYFETYIRQERRKASVRS